MFLLPDVSHVCFNPVDLLYINAYMGFYSRIRDILMVLLCQLLLRHSIDNWYCCKNHQRTWYTVKQSCSTGEQLERY